jgi:peroxiredoxin
MNVSRVVSIVAVAAAVAVTSCSSRKSEGGEAKAGAAAPNFVLKTAEGGTIDLQALRGKVVVVNFWATWCGPCRSEMPGMMKVYDRLKGRGVEIVGVSLDRRGWEDVRPYLAKNSVNYPIVVGDEDLAKAYNLPNAIPYTVFIDRQGNIVKNHTGYMAEELFEQEVMKLL